MEAHKYNSAITQEQAQVTAYKNLSSNFIEGLHYIFNGDVQHSLIQQQPHHINGETSLIGRDMLEELEERFRN